jgi:hypothetical protein
MLITIFSHRAVWLPTCEKYGTSASVILRAFWLVSPPDVPATSKTTVSTGLSRPDNGSARELAGPATAIAIKDHMKSNDEARKV